MQLDSKFQIMTRYSIWFEKHSTELKQHVLPLPIAFLYWYISAQWVTLTFDLAFRSAIRSAKP